LASALSTILQRTQEDGKYSIARILALAESIAEDALGSVSLEGVLGLTLVSTVGIIILRWVRFLRAFVDSVTSRIVVVASIFVPEVARPLTRISTIIRQGVKR